VRRNAPRQLESGLYVHVEHDLHAKGWPVTTLDCTTDRPETIAARIVTSSTTSSGLAAAEKRLSARRMAQSGSAIFQARFVRADRPAFAVFLFRRMVERRVPGGCGPNGRHSADVFTIRVQWLG
jgi:hypothetical protein